MQIIKQNQIVRFKERQIEKLMTKTRPTRSWKTKTPKPDRPTGVMILPLSRIITLSKIQNKALFKPYNGRKHKSNSTVWAMYKSCVVGDLLKFWCFDIILLIFYGILIKKRCVAYPDKYSRFSLI